MKNRILYMVMMLFLLLFLVTGCTQQIATPVSKEVKDDIVIGSIMPLSGDAAVYGVPMQQSAILAVEEINNNGGINGHQLKVIYEDGLCNPKDGLLAAQKLINVNQVHVILGGLCSGETLGAAPLAESTQTILFSPGSGSPEVTYSGDYIFRNYPSDSAAGKATALNALANGDLQVAILAENTDYVQDAKEVFKKTLINGGGQVIVDEKFLSDELDFRTSLSKIKDLDVDAIYIATQTQPPYNLILKQMKALDINVQIYTTEYAATADTLSQYGDVVEGSIYAEPFFDVEGTLASAFLERFVAKYGELSANVPPIYLATTYDAVYMLRDGILQCGKNTDCIKTYLYNVENRNGASGVISIDENGDVDFTYRLMQIENGAPVVME